MFENVRAEDLVARLASHDFGAPPDATYDQLMGADEIDAIVAFDRLERLAAAGRAEAIARLDVKRHRTLNAERTDNTWVDDADIARSIVTEIAMARQMSASGAQTLYGFALALTHHPRTAALLSAGTISERVARAVTDRTWPLSAAGRRWVDDRLAPDLPLLTAKRAAAAAARLSQAYDPHAAHVRAVTARASRFVSAVAKPDVMGMLNLYAPADQIQAAYTALDNHARATKADGDDRTLSQIMADTAVERLTGASRADDIGVEVNVLMRPETLLGDEDTPALLAGYGPIPAATARQLTGRSRAWVRRLFTDPTCDTITGRDARRRRFDGPLGELIRAADQHCQRPWCDCRISDIDHRQPHSDGGPTVRDNADGYCRGSHHIRHLPGFHVSRPSPDDPVIQWTTPTGHRYRSRRPGPLGHGPQVTIPHARNGRSILEQRLLRLLCSHGHLRQ